MEQLDLHRLHFGFTIIFHYLFPQLTMGLALLILVLKTMALRGDQVADAAVRFWTKIFGVTFGHGRNWPRSGHRSLRAFVPSCLP